MFKKITRKHLDIFLKKYATNERVLDIGSGGSSYGVYFPNRLTVDVDPLRKPEVVADIHKLPFNENEFSFVLCTEVVEHVIDPSLAIKELYRVLKPGGTLILSTRFVYPIHDSPNDYWRFTYFGMQRLFKGWEIIELTPEAKTFETIAVLMQRIGFQTRLRLNKISKLLIFFAAYIISKLDFLIEAEYGDIGKKAETPHLMASGYYIAARKPLKSFN